jgi:hypothetical protein
MDVNRKIAITLFLIVLVILVCLIITWGVTSNEHTGCGKILTPCDAVHLNTPLNLSVYQTDSTAGKWIATWYPVPNAKSYEVVLTTTVGSASYITTTAYYEFTLSSSQAPPANQITVRVTAKLDECNLKSGSTSLTLP